MNSRSVVVSWMAAFLIGPLASLAVGQSTDEDLPVLQERLVLDDMEDVSDWYNGTPVESTISTTGRRTKQGDTALLFDVHVNHREGEKNYPIGWPRAGKDLEKAGLSDFSGSDFFECWIYVETSRESLPKVPLSVGFYHTGQKRSTSFRLTQVEKDRWTKIAIPISEIEQPADVRRVQFNISESDYGDGDHVAFYIDDMVLTRFARPVVGQFATDRRVVYASDREIIASYRLMGYRDTREMARLSIGRVGSDAVDEKIVPVTAVEGEIVLPLSSPPAKGRWWALLQLRGPEGEPGHGSEVRFRVIDGPF